MEKKTIEEQRPVPSTRFRKDVQMVDVVKQIPREVEKLDKEEKPILDEKWEIVKEIVYDEEIEQKEVTRFLEIETVVIERERNLDRIEKEIIELDGRIKDLQDAKIVWEWRKAEILAL